MAPLTSEAIAKSLKGAGLTSEARIQLATEAWQDDRVFFPRKDDFLLEWLCTALCRPSKE
ncbi:hypothetical protein BCR43DRAFT_443528 [Syncephalastrum racemosum]|uniref:Uncharacterized protein n=1 Tax=Syncephalastrum racemosum TaxID=13706 RepID=A0A1X2H661_SYNRA|nr:hypothetical protein BCR43DRAFT_443528 [Syncephalastrum racemosum]